MLIFSYYGMPLHIVRDLWVSIKNLQRRIASYFRYRKITANLNDRFPNPTEEELQETDRTCIICREEMNPEGCKKLPCSHIFHVDCLKMWVQRQQVQCVVIVIPLFNTQYVMVAHPYRSCGVNVRLVQLADPQSQPDLVLPWCPRLQLSLLLSPLLVGCQMERPWLHRCLRFSRTRCRSISEMQGSQVLQERFLFHMRMLQLYQRQQHQLLTAQLQFIQAHQERHCIHLRQRTRHTCRRSCLLQGWVLHLGTACLVRLAWRHSLDTLSVCSSRHSLVLATHLR